MLAEIKWIHLTVISITYRISHHYARVWTSIRDRYADCENLLSMYIID